MFDTHVFLGKKVLQHSGVEALTKSKLQGRNLHHPTGNGTLYPKKYVFQLEKQPLSKSHTASPTTVRRVRRVRRGLVP